MLIKVPGWQIPESQVTDESEYRNRHRTLSRRGFLQAGTALGAAGAFPHVLGASRQLLTHDGDGGATPGWMNEKLANIVLGEPSSKEAVTPFEHVTRYNNFYEFGTGKDDPSENAQGFQTDPWSVEVSGEAQETGKFTLEDIVGPHGLEERIYRLRCVEAWSMVVPWIGFPLADLIKRFKPTSNAKYVRFETLYSPSQMPGQRSLFTSIDYPYVEGLRMDEAMNELAFIAVGLYGNALPPQNGAPLRLIVPWKYGFKSIKSIVKISFHERRFRTTWEKSNASEYGFYANVNPSVDHPRWSQASERRLPGSLFSSNRIDTLMFNGYAEQVAHLYKGMDLARYY